MQVAVVLYPGFTALDMVGPFEVLAFVPGMEMVLVADRPGPVADETGLLGITAAASFEEVPRPDVVVVPGGPGQTGQMTDGRLHEWLRAVDRTSAWTTSVCTGSLIPVELPCRRGSPRCYATRGPLSGLEPRCQVRGERVSQGNDERDMV